LQADTEVVAAALASPFYAEPLPPVPPSCVLRFAAEELTITTYTYAAAPVAAAAAPAAAAAAVAATAAAAAAAAGVGTAS